MNAFYLKLSYIFAAFLYVVSTICLGACDSLTKDEIFESLGKGIELNEKFKRSVGTSNRESYNSLRESVETYSEKVALPCLRDVVDMRTKNKEIIELIVMFVISFENAADETIALSIGKSYVDSPSQIDDVVVHLPTEQCIIAIDAIGAGVEMLGGDIEMSILNKRKESLEVVRKECGKTVDK